MYYVVMNVIAVWFMFEGTNQITEVVGIGLGPQTRVYLSRIFFMVKYNSSYKCNFHSEL